MSGTRKKVTRNSLIALLNKHNSMFPTMYLNATVSNKWVTFHNSNKLFTKKCQGFLKAYNYLKNRVYYNKDGKTPNLGYTGNKNRAIKR